MLLKGVFRTKVRWARAGIKMGRLSTGGVNMTKDREAFKIRREED